LVVHPGSPLQRFEDEGDTRDVASHRTKRAPRGALTIAAVIMVVSFSPIPALAQPPAQPAPPTTASEALKQYQDLRNGRRHSFLEEEAFERIIDYFDDTEDIPQAIEAVELGIEQYPYSSALLIKKADLMIATRRYYEALAILEQAGPA